MSDYNPDPRLNNPYGTQRRHEYTEDTSERSSFAFIALLAIVALVGGVVMFAQPKPADQQAQVPVPTTTAPAERLAVPPVAPATPRTATPPAAPAAPAAPQQ